MAIEQITGAAGPAVSKTSDGNQVQVSRNEPTKSQDETGGTGAVDTVSLTDAAERLRGLENTLANLPVMDSQRVEEIQQAIDRGTFEVDYGRVADKFLNFERDLGR